MKASWTKRAGAMAALLLLAGLVLAQSTETAMPLNGLWKVITLQIKETVGGAVRATITHDGTDVVVSDSISTTGLSSSGKVTVGGVFSLVTSTPAVVASATTIAPTKGVSYITGATAITGATIGPWTAGTIQAWCNVGGDATGPVVTDGNNLVMAGNLTLGPNDCLTFVSDGTNLIELSRSVN